MDFENIKKCVYKTSHILNADINIVLQILKEELPKYKNSFFKIESIINLTQIPREIQYKIMMDLNLDELLNLCSVSKKMNKVCSENFWKYYAKNKYKKPKYTLKSLTFSDDEKAIEKYIEKNYDTWKDVVIDLESENQQEIANNKMREINAIIKNGTLTQFKKKFNEVKTLKIINKDNFVPIFIRTVEDARESIVRFLLNNKLFNFSKIKQYLKGTLNLPNNIYELIGNKIYIINQKEDHLKSPNERWINLHPREKTTNKQKREIKAITKMFLEDKRIPQPSEDTIKKMMEVIDVDYVDIYHLVTIEKYYVLWSIYMFKKKKGYKGSWSDFFKKRGYSRSPFF